MRKMVIVGMGLALTGVALLYISIGDTGDTPCGSPLRANFSWNGICGKYYRWQLAGAWFLIGSGIGYFVGGIAGARFGESRREAIHQP